MVKNKHNDIDTIKAMFPGIEDVKKFVTNISH